MSSKKFSDFYFQTMHHQLFAPVAYAFMKKAPWIYAASRSQKAFRPIEEKLKFYGSWIERLRQLYYSHTLYDMALLSICDMPETVLHNLLIDRADGVKVYEFLDHVLIVNNLCPTTFIYDDATRSNGRYVWAYHSSYKNLLNWLESGDNAPGGFAADIS